MNWTKVFILQLVFQPCLQAVPLTTNAEQASYRGELGGDVVMGCRFHPLSPHPYDDLMMAWYWISGARFREVYRLDHGQEQVSFQHPDFRGRARVLVDGIKDGWARLQVSRLRINDTGMYQCVVRTRNGADYKDIKLSVTAPYKTVTKSISKSAAGGELVLSCQSEGYPVSTVAWEDAHGQKAQCQHCRCDNRGPPFQNRHSDEIQRQKESTNNANVTQIAFGTCIGIAMIGLIIVLIHLRRKGLSRKEQKTSVTQLEEQTYCKEHQQGTFLKGPLVDNSSEAKTRSERGTTRMLDLLSSVRLRGFKLYCRTSEERHSSVEWEDEHLRSCDISAEFQSL